MKSKMRRTYKEGAMEIDFDRLISFLTENKDRLSGNILSDGLLEDGSEFVEYRVITAPEKESGT